MIALLQKIFRGALAVWLATTVSLAFAATWSPRDFGAKGDGAHRDTAAIQRAIDAAHADGGGQVRIDAGTYLIGTIELRTGIDLHLEKGATLRGVADMAAYRRGNWPALVLARNQERVSITGEGTINGNGKAVAAETVRLYEKGELLAFFPGVKRGELVFTGIGTDKNPWIDPHAMMAAGTLAARVAPRDREDVATWRVDEFVRPQAVEFWHCRNVTVEGISIHDAANWVLVLRECEDVRIERTKVKSTTYWNNDGIDIVNCRRVLIQDCDVNAADDGICLKSDVSPDGRRCDDVVVRRCRVRSSASAIKFGTASHVGFTNIVVEDVEVYDTYRSAIAIETVDGGLIENVRVSRVTARNTGNAFFLRLGQRNDRKPPGVLRNVVIEDLDVEVPAGRPDAGYEHAGPPLKVAANPIPSSIVGLPDRVIEQVVLRRINVRYAGNARRDVAHVPWDQPDAVPEKRANYPEYSMFGELPAWALYVRDASGVVFEDVTFSLGGVDFRPAMALDRVSNVVLERSTISNRTEGPVAVVSRSRDVRFDRMSWPAGEGDNLRTLP